MSGIYVTTREGSWMRKEEISIISNTDELGVDDMREQVAHCLNTEERDWKIADSSYQIQMRDDSEVNLKFKLSRSRSVQDSIFYHLPPSSPSSPPSSLLHPLSIVLFYFYLYVVLTSNHPVVLDFLQTRFSSPTSPSSSCLYLIQHWQFLHRPAVTCI